MRTQTEDTTDTTATQEPTEEERRAAEAQAEADFAAGYAKVAKPNADPKAGDQKDDANTQAAAAAPEKSDAEKQAEERARVEAEAKVTEEKLWEGVPGVVRERLTSLAALTGRMSNIEGHIGGLKNATGRIENALKAAKTAAESAGGAAAEPSEKQVQAAMSDPKAWDRMMEEFPDLAGPMGAELAAIRKEIATKSTASFDVDGLKQEVETNVKDAISDVEERTYLRLKHPNWRTDVKTPEFKSWFKKQPEDVKALSNSHSGDDASKLLDNFYEHTARTAKAVKDKDLQQRRIASAVTPKGTTVQAQPGSLSDEEAAVRGYRRARGRR